jgi:hypothetical protein
MKIRAALIETIKGHAAAEEVEQQTFSIPLPELKIPKEDDDTQGAGPKLYVRDDGTVDWDGALQDKDALRNFGTAVWARINGQNPEFGLEDNLQAVEEQGLAQHGGSSPKPVTVKIEETDEIKRDKALLDLRRAELRDLEVKHFALLNSGNDNKCVCVDAGGMCVDAGGLHGGLTVGRLARENLCSAFVWKLEACTVECVCGCCRRSSCVFVSCIARHREKIVSRHILPQNTHSSHGRSGRGKYQFGHSRSIAPKQNSCILRWTRKKE